MCGFKQRSQRQSISSTINDLSLTQSLWAVKLAENNFFFVTCPKIVAYKEKKSKKTSPVIFIPHMKANKLACLKNWTFA